MNGEKLPGKWVYGGIFHQDDLGVSFAVIYSYDPIEKHVVYADTVGQFTGLTDRNGIKIFEGDILSFQHPFGNRHGIYRVVYSGYGFGCLNFYQPHYDTPNDAFSEGTEYFTVIGNVYDNPELIKKE